MNLIPATKMCIAATAAALAGMSLTSCTAKDEGENAQEIAVTASDTECKLSTTQASTGSVKFVVTNNGTKETEFYVYQGDKVVEEREGISPGTTADLTVQLTEAGTYQTACKPGGDASPGIRGDFTITGEAAKANA